MKLKKEKDVTVRILSRTDGEESFLETTGEYAYQEGIHHIAYTQYTGNIITRCGLFIGEDKMLLHRSGGISGDMLFQQGTAAKFEYEALLTGTAFLLYTDRYVCFTDETGVHAAVTYSLGDGDAVLTKSSQVIDILFDQDMGEPGK